MYNENDFEVNYAPGAVIKGILEAPEAAELALDELRRNPIHGNASEHLSEIEQKHGTDVLEYYGFLFQVINNSRAFLDIDFDPRVDDAVASDITQQEVETEIFAHLRNKDLDDDLNPELVISRSKRANMLRMVASLAIQDKLESMKSKPKLEIQIDTPVNSLITM